MNNLLHYAVSAQNIDLLCKLYQEKPVLALFENVNQERAVDWFRDYVYARIHCLIAPKILQQTPSDIFKGNIAAIKELLVERKMPTKLRFHRGETLLHLAVRASQAKLVRLILDSTDVSLIEPLLNTRNIFDETPPKIAQAVLEKQASPIRENIVNLLQQAQQRAATAANNNQLVNHTAQLQPILIDLFKVNKLSLLLTAEVKENDLAELNQCLPTLCALAYLTCQQAAAMLNSLNTLSFFEDKSSQQNQAEQLLKKLFGPDYSKDIGNYLHQKIINIVDYLAKLIHLQQIDQIISISMSEPRLMKDSLGSFIPRGGTLFLKNKINLYPNTTGVINLAIFVGTLIHECCHLVNHDYDLIYHKLTCQANEGCDINLQKSFALATQLKYTKKSISEHVKSENLKLLDTLIKLEHLPWGRGTSYSLKNADTIMTAIKGLAAIQNEQATLKECILSIDGTFLSASYLKSQQESLPSSVRLIDSRGAVTEDFSYKSPPRSPGDAVSTSPGSDQSTNEVFPTDAELLKQQIVSSGIGFDCSSDSINPLLGNDTCRLPSPALSRLK